MKSLSAAPSKAAETFNLQTFVFYKLKRKLKALFVEHKSLIKFGVVGLTGSIIDIGVLTLLVEVFNLDIVFSNACSVALAIVNNFLLNKLWTFRDTSKNYTEQFFKYATVSFIGWLMNIVLMKLFLWLGWFYLIAKVVIIMIVSGWNYLLNKLWTFKQPDILK
jgi:putative flippase GtrA